MPRRRIALVAALVLTPLVAFAVAAAVLRGGGDGTAVEARADGTTTTSSSSTSSTTTAAPSTTTTSAAAPKLTPASPLPSVPQPGEPVAASSPTEMAGQLRAAWASIETNAADAPRQAHVYQVVIRALANESNAGQREPTYDALGDDAELVAQVRGDVAATAKLRTLVGKPRTSLPPWRIVEPAPPDELLGHYHAAEAEFGVGWQYLAAINLVETRMGRIRGTSDAGAQGPMQFLRATWDQYGEGGDINSYRDSIRAAARYLKRNGAPGDMRNAVWNYNHSDLYVDAVLAYAERMAASEAAFRSYYHWQVYYVTTAGDVWLPVGYGA